MNMFIGAKDLYSLDFGRPAWPAEVLFRMLFLEFYYNLSDVEVSNQCPYNLLYRWFVGLHIEEKVPDDTSLVVFRRRLGEERFERLFSRIVEKTKEQGLLKERYKLVDATAIVADVAIPDTVNLLRQGRRVVMREIGKVDGRAAKRLETPYSSHEKLSQKPTGEELVEEVKMTYCFISEVRGRYGSEVEEKVEALEAILEPGEGKEKVVSFIDFDARHGRKSVKRMFSGYKAHVVEDESEIVKGSGEGNKSGSGWRNFPIIMMRTAFFVLRGEEKHWEPGSREGHPLLFFGLRL